MSNIIKLCLFIAYALISSYGLYKLKISSFGINVGFISGFMFYAIGFVIWLYILKIYPLSVAFPLASGSLVVITQIVGVSFLGEAATLNKGIGAIFIIAGIALVYLES